MGLIVLPSTRDTILPVSCKGMWQSMHRVSIAWPIFLKSPQLSTWWHIMHREANDAVSRWTVWTSWQVMHVIALLDRKHRLASRSGTCLAWTSTRTLGSHRSEERRVGKECR